MLPSSITRAAARNRLPLCARRQKGEILRPVRTESVSHAASCVDALIVRLRLRQAEFSDSAETRNLGMCFGTHR